VGNTLQLLRKDKKPIFFINILTKGIWKGMRWNEFMKLMVPLKEQLLVEQGRYGQSMLRIGRKARLLYARD